MLPSAETWLALVTGAAVGWITTLSGSTFAQLFVTAALGIASGGATAVASLVKRGVIARATAASSVASAVSLSMIGALAIGLAVGGTGAAVAKARQWLEPNADQIAARWSATGLDRHEIAKRVFEKQFGTARNGSDDAAGRPQSGQDESKAAVGHGGTPADSGATTASGKPAKGSR